MNLGGGEVLVILLVALLVLGPTRLPEAARQAGKAMKTIRQVSTGFQDEMRHAIEDTIEADAAKDAGVSHTPASKPGARRPPPPDPDDQPDPGGPTDLTADPVEDAEAGTEAAEDVADAPEAATDAVTDAPEASTDAATDAPEASTDAATDAPEAATDAATDAPEASTDAATDVPEASTEAAPEVDAVEPDSDEDAEPTTRSETSD